MSTLSMQQSSTLSPASLPLPFMVETTKGEDSSIDLLLAMSEIRPQDRVMVIGRNLSAHLVALAHCGCHSATGVTPESLYLRKEPADVMWITGFNEISAPLASALLRMAESSRVAPRLIAIELAAAESLGKMQPFLQQLRDMGFARRSYRQAEDHLVVTAHRAGWWQWVA